MIVSHKHVICGSLLAMALGCGPLPMTRSDKAKLAIKLMEVSKENQRKLPQTGVSGAAASGMGPKTTGSSLTSGPPKKKPSTFADHLAIKKSTLPDVKYDLSEKPKLKRIYIPPLDKDETD
jgi:hypothetical protein